MSNFNIIRAHELNVSDITYGAAKSLDSGGKSIYMSYRGNPITLQTAEMVAPFGLSRWDNKDKPPKYTLNISFKGRNENQRIKEFYDKMTELDNKLVKDGALNSIDWLKKGSPEKPVSEDVIRALYTSLVVYPQESKYDPTFKLSIPFKDDKFTCKVYDANRNVLDLNSVNTKGAKITAMIQCLGVWTAAGKFGVTWKVIQMRVVPATTLSEYAFIDDEDDNKNKIKSKVEKHSDDEDTDEEDTCDDDTRDDSDDELDVKKK